MSTQPNFNPIARPYKYLEYLTLGPVLQHCRTHFLPALLEQKSALVLGDGDGRFLAQLLAANPTLLAEAVDTSRTMLKLLEANCAAASPTAAARLKTHQTSAQAFLQTLPAARQYDLVVTHFFLDCLTQPELEALIRTLKPHLAPAALWLISDFHIPQNGPFRLVGQLLVRGLYLAFRLLTGLRTTRLPNYATPLAAAGLSQIAHHNPVGGLLTTEIWRRQDSSTQAQSVT